MSRLATLLLVALSLLSAGAASAQSGGPNDLLIAVTEKYSRAELDRFAAALKEASCN